MRQEILPNKVDDHSATLDPNDPNGTHTAGKTLLGVQANARRGFANPFWEGYGALFGQAFATISHKSDVLDEFNAVVEEKIRNLFEETLAEQGGGNVFCGEDVYTVTIRVSADGSTITPANQYEHTLE